MNDSQTKGTEKSGGRGFSCRKCGHRHFRVIYTRPASGGKVVRRRECRTCGNRITTWERTIGCWGQGQSGAKAAPEKNGAASDHGTSRPSAGHVED